MTFQSRFASLLLAALALALGAPPLHAAQPLRQLVHVEGARPRAGVAPEHARMLLSLNHYTHWLWNQDLHNLMHFLSLRDHSHAQVEAQAYAKAIDQLVRTHLPATMELYDQHRRLA